jgi:hypothetical protein
MLTTALLAVAALIGFVGLYLAWNLLHFFLEAYGGRPTQRRKII